MTKPTVRQAKPAISKPRKPASRAAPSRHDDPPAFALMTEISIIAQLAQHAAARLVAPELNMPQFIVLNHLVRRGQDSSLVDLASAMQLTKGAMSNTVARLHGKCFVAVESDPADGRGKRVRITLQGRAARDLAVARLGRGLAGLEPLLPRAELEGTLKALGKLRRWFERDTSANLPPPQLGHRQGAHRGR